MSGGVNLHAHMGLPDEDLYALIQHAHIEATARQGLSRVTVGSFSEYHGQQDYLAPIFTALGWTEERHDRDCPPDAVLRAVRGIPGRETDVPHPRAGQPNPWWRFIPAGYDWRADPAEHGTQRAVEAAGNSDGAGRGGTMYARHVTAATPSVRDLIAMRRRQRTLDA